MKVHDTRFEAIIGLEVHVRLQLNTKIFSGDINDYGLEPNTLISEISLGYPGTLPRVNKKAIEYAVKMGLACHSQIASEVSFDRKNYMYPDLPKGYQITQDRIPVCNGGYIHIRKDDTDKQIVLNRIHLEEDAGKSIHDKSEDGTLIDFNRAGTALIEIVTEPVLHSGDEAYAFLYEIRRLVRCLGISDGNMEEGSLRCDANISIRRIGDTQLGRKVEIKNMNSLNNVRKAIVFEIKRQIDLKQNGKEIISETRTFNPVAGSTSAMRVKETLTDYRYFPDPDLPPVLLTAEWLEGVRHKIPELPFEKEQRFRKEYGLSVYDASVLTSSDDLATFFESVAIECRNYKSAANWIMGPVLSVLNSKSIQIEEFDLAPKQIAGIIGFIEAGKLSYSVASRKLFPALLDTPESDIEELAEKMHLFSGQEEELVKAVNEVIEEFPKETEMLRNGKQKLLGMFMGKIMKKTKGLADPNKAKQMLLDTLKNT